MKKVKQYILRMFFTVEIYIFCGNYFFGTQGLPTIIKLQKENAQLESELEELQQHKSNLQSAIDQWNSSPFYKEKYAREQLQMAYPHEKVYIIP